LFLASTFDNIIKLWVLNEQKLGQPAEQGLKLTPKIFKATDRDGIFNLKTWGYIGPLTLI
jgi:hypothetical protein